MRKILLIKEDDNVNKKKSTKCQYIYRREIATISLTINLFLIAQQTISPLQ